jgi:hypothetical protein
MFLFSKRGMMCDVVFANNLIDSKLAKSKTTTRTAKYRCSKVPIQGPPRHPPSQLCQLSGAHAEGADKDIFHNSVCHLVNLSFLEASTTTISSFDKV